MSLRSNMSSAFKDYFLAWLLVFFLFAQPEGFTQGGGVHRGAGHSRKPGRRAEKRHVLRDDAHVGRAHQAGTLGRSIAELGKVGHENQAHRSRRRKVLSGSHGRPKVTVGHKNKALAGGVIAIGPLRSGHINVDLLTVHGRRGRAFALGGAVDAVGRPKQVGQVGRFERAGCKRAVGVTGREGLHQRRRARHVGGGQSYDLVLCGYRSRHGQAEAEGKNTFHRA